MSPEEFMSNCANTWGDWDVDDDSAQFRKKRVFWFVSKFYTEEELDNLWELAEKKLKYRPRVKDLNDLKEGKATGLIRRRKIETPNIAFGELPFNTRAAQRFAEQLKPIFEIKIAGDAVLNEFLTDEQKSTMRSRANTFMDILMKLMGEPKEGQPS